MQYFGPKLNGIVVLVASEILLVQTFTKVFLRAICITICHLKTLKSETVFFCLCQVFQISFKKAETKFAALCKKFLKVSITLSPYECLYMIIAHSN